MVGQTNAQTTSSLVLLWTNPNHAAAFSEQDVTVDVSSYKLVLVFFQEYAPASDRQEGRWELGVVERTNVQMRATVHFGTSSEPEKNRGWKVTTTGVHFWSGWAGSGNNNNGQCVPWYIYGIKL